MLVALKNQEGIFDKYPTKADKPVEFQQVASAVNKSLLKITMPKKLADERYRRVFTKKQCKYFIQQSAKLNERFNNQNIKSSKAVYTKINTLLKEIADTTDRDEILEKTLDVCALYEYIYLTSSQESTRITAFISRNVSLRPICLEIAVVMDEEYDIIYQRINNIMKETKYERA